MNMNYNEFEWRGADGARMFGCEWLPGEDRPVRATIGLVHGMGEHAGRYSHVAEVLTADGYAVQCFDQHGHGRSEGKRGHTPSYDALLEGIDIILSEAERRHPGVPRFLYGHSLGGNVMLNFLLRRKPALTGAIASGPWLKLSFQPPPLEVVVGRIVERFYPQYTSKRPLIAENLTSDPEMIRRYVEDPLGHGQITAKFFFGVQRAGLWALAHASELHVPLLLLHGGDDKVTSIHASRQFAEQAGALCSFLEIPGFRHELHNELHRDEVFTQILRWLNERLSTSANHGL